MTALKSTSNTLLQTDYYKVIHMVKGQSNVFVVELLNNATDFSPAYTAMPSNTEPPSEQDAVYDFFDEPDNKTTKDWRKKLGEFAISKVAKPEMSRTGAQWPKTRPDYSYLVNWPRGYKLFTHKKGHCQDYRKDSYLYGSQHVRCFRSPAEFFLHLQWLMTGSPSNADGEPDCHCCYCDPSMTQGEISQQFSHYTPRDRRAARDDQGRRQVDSNSPIPAKDYTKLDVASLA